MHEEWISPGRLRQRRREGLIAGLLFAGVMGSLVVGNWNALVALAGTWMSEGHSSELLALAIAGWLLWRVRHELAAIPLETDWRGWLLVAPAAAGLLVADVVDVRAAQMPLLLVAVCGMVWLLLGRAALRVTAYPIGFLILALPIWDYPKPLLQDMTVRATEVVLNALGVPVFVDETYINIPSGTMLVLEECSGARFFQAGVTLGALFAYLNLRKIWTRMAVVTLFGGIVIFGNWLRVCTLVFLGPQSELQHYSIGWAVFVISVIPACWLALRLRSYEDTVWHARGSAARPREPDCRSSANSVSKRITIAGLAIVLLVFLPLTADRYIKSFPEELIHLMPFEPAAPWSGPYEAGDNWRPAFNNPSVDASATYRAAKREVTLYVAYYGSQEQGAEAVNEENSVYNLSNWDVRGGNPSGTLRRVAIGNAGQALTIIETQLESVHGGSVRLVWHWFRVAGRDAAVSWRAKLLQIVGLTERRNDAAAIVLSAVASDVDEARSSLAAFLQANFFRIGAMLNTHSETQAVDGRDGF